jgi:Potato inhibitor I family
MIGNVRTNNKEGPWPDCLGMTGEECQSYVQHYACRSSNNDEDCQVVIVPLDAPPSALTKDFLPNRIRIFVNATGYVTLIPDRG